MDNIKVIFWVPDETLWLGHVSKGDALMSENSKQLLKLLNSKGVRNIIFASNMMEHIKSILNKEKIDRDVFSVIDDKPTGFVIEKYLEQNKIDPLSVLVIDASDSERTQIKDYIPGISVGDIGILPDLFLLATE